MRVGACPAVAARQSRAFFQAFPDLCEARLAAGAYPGQVHLHAVVGFVELQPHDVNSLASPAGGQLHARHEVDVRGVAGRAGLAQPRRGVVVGQRQRGHAAAARPLDQMRGRQHAIGKMAVRVEIDEGFIACIHSGVRMIRAACHRHPN
jgi:hypothetical protein